MTVDGTAPCLLAVFAHPDDETFGCGGLLAKYAALGVRVALVCATRGEAGEISDPSLADRDNLGEVREGELRAACDALGISDLFILDYRDSGMDGTDDNKHPDAFCNADHDQVVGRVVEIVRELKPQVVVTFDSKGGYGHPDHIKAHHVAVQAFGAAGDPGQYPEHLGDGLQPHVPSKLYQVVFPRSFVIELRQAMKEADMNSDLEDTDEDSWGTPDEQITTEINVADVKLKKEQAARAHRTQIQGDEPFSWLPESFKDKFLSTEYLVRMEPPFSLDNDPREKDLFS